MLSRVKWHYHPSYTKKTTNIYTAYLTIFVHYFVTVNIQLSSFEHQKIVLTSCPNNTCYRNSKPDRKSTRRRSSWLGRQRISPTVRTAASWAQTLPMLGDTSNVGRLLGDTSNVGIRFNTIWSHCKYFWKTNIKYMSMIPQGLPRWRETSGRTP